MLHQIVSPNIQTQSLPALFLLKRLASAFTSAILVRIPTQSLTPGVTSFLCAWSSPQTFLSFQFTALKYFMEYCALRAGNRQNTLLVVLCLSATCLSEELPLLSLIHFFSPFLDLNIIKQRRVATGILL